MTAETGQPLSFTGASNQGIATRPNITQGVGVRAAHPSRTQWFNPAAFTNPANYSF